MELSDKSKEEEHIHYQIQSLRERQIENELTLSQCEKVEEHFFTIDKRSESLFDRLHTVWKKDKDFIQLLEQRRTEYDRSRRNIYHHLDNKRQILVKEKQTLHDIENDLFYQKRKKDL